MNVCARDGGFHGKDAERGAERGEADPPVEYQPPTLRLEFHTAGVTVRLLPGGAAYRRAAANSPENVLPSFPPGSASFFAPGVPGNLQRSPVAKLENCVILAQSGAPKWSSVPGFTLRPVSQ